MRTTDTTYAGYSRALETDSISWCESSVACCLICISLLSLSPGDGILPGLAFSLFPYHHQEQLAQFGFALLSPELGVGDFLPLFAGYEHGRRSAGAPRHGPHEGLHQPLHVHAVAGDHVVVRRREAIQRLSPVVLEHLFVCHKLRASSW